MERIVSVMSQQEQQKGKQVNEGDPCFEKACGGVLIEDGSTYTCSDCGSQYGERSI